MTATASTYEVHPLAHLLPEMREAEYAELRDDIAANGLHEAITLYDEQILDGRHRYRACTELGVGAHYVVYDGEAPAAYVLSLNVKRRQLSQSQKAMIATDFLPHLREEARQRQAHGMTAPGRSMERLDSEDSKRSDEPNPGRSAQHAAEQVGVGHAQVVRANRVKQDDPDLAQRVRDGEITVTAAHALVTGKSHNTAPGPPKVTNNRPLGSRWSRKPTELVENVVGMVEALPGAIDSIDVQSAVASPDAPLVDWDRRLSSAITALVKLRNQIRGANA